MTYSGGMRLRLIFDSFYMMLRNSLSESGLLDTTPAGWKNSVKIIPEPVDPSKKVEPNTISLMADFMNPSPAELGSYRQRRDQDVYVDIFAESERAGIHIMGDLLSAIEGESRDTDVLPVFDYSQVGQPEVFYCEIKDIEAVRLEDGEKGFNRFWWRIGCTLEDENS